MILRHLFVHFALLIGLVKLYYYMKNFCNLIGLKQWYFSLLILKYLHVKITNLLRVFGLTLYKQIIA